MHIIDTDAEPGIDKTPPTRLVGREKYFDELADVVTLIWLVMIALAPAVIVATYRVLW